MGKLSIIYQDLNNQSERILWQVASGQERGWKFGSVTFDITSFLYKVKNFSQSFWVMINIYIGMIELGSVLNQTTAIPPVIANVHHFPTSFAIV